MLNFFGNDHSSPLVLDRQVSVRDLRAIRTVSFLVFLTGLMVLTLFEIRTVRGRSMEPLLREGSVVVIFRWAYGPRLPILDHYLGFWNTPTPGDLVAFYNPSHWAESLKVVAFGPGESLTLDGDFLVGGNLRIPLLPYQKAGVERLARLTARQVFVVGLNFEQSTDSRDYGPVPLVALTGRVLFSLP